MVVCLLKKSPLRKPSSVCTKTAPDLVPNPPLVFLTLRRKCGWLWLCSQEEKLPWDNGIALLPLALLIEPGSLSDVGGAAETMPAARRPSVAQRPLELWPQCGEDPSGFSLLRLLPSLVRQSTNPVSGPNEAHQCPLGHTLRTHATQASSILPEPLNIQDTHKKYSRDPP